MTGLGSKADIPPEQMSALANTGRSVAPKKADLIVR
jgi:hypothetical protein